MTAEDRYFSDPLFHALVDTIHAAIEQKQYTATEVRDAAMLAAIHYEQRHMRDMFTHRKAAP